MMLHHLTNYLLQYKTVCIPHVGTLQLVQRPPVLNVPDKRIEPPAYQIERTAEENPSEHQLLFLGSFAHKAKEAVQSELQSFGYAFKQKMLDGGFPWEGLGTIKEDQTLVISMPGLQSTAAEKIIRQDASHTVLVGDKELTSAEALEQRTIAPVSDKRWPLPVVVGWIILLLALIAIGVLLFLGKFNAAAAGSKLSPTSFIVHTNSFCNA